MVDELFDVRAEADKLLLAVRFLADLNLDGISEAVSHAHVLGPIVDPTAYRDMLFRKGNMDDVARLANLAKPVVAEFRQLQERLGDG